MFLCDQTVWRQKDVRISSLRNWGGAEASNRAMMSGRPALTRSVSVTRNGKFYKTIFHIENILSIR